MVRLTRRSVLILAAGAATIALPAVGASCSDTGTTGGFADDGE